MMANTIVFDLGKVLLDFDYGIAARELARFCREPAEEVRRVIEQSALLHRYESNEIGTEEFFDEIRELTGFCGGYAEFCLGFGDIFSPIEPLVRLHADLRKRGFPTYIFSNTNPLAVGHIREKYPFFKQFDGYILSYEQGAMKPDPKIYEAVEEATGKTGAELLYIDDRLENVEAGAARGWRVILQETPAGTIEQVARYVERSRLSNGAS